MKVNKIELSNNKIMIYVDDTDSGGCNGFVFESLNNYGILPKINKIWLNGTRIIIKSNIGDIDCKERLSESHLAERII